MSVVGLTLPHGLVFEDLYRRDGLLKLDGAFLTHLSCVAPTLVTQLTEARANPPTGKSESDLLTALAPHVEEFVADLFGIRAEVSALKGRHTKLAPLYVCKRLFVQRRVAKSVKPDTAAGLDSAVVTRRMEERLGGPIDELAFANAVLGWMDAEADHVDDLAAATDYAAWALHTQEGRARHGALPLFQIPRKVDSNHLITLECENLNGVPVFQNPPERLRQRNGFNLTDPGADLAGALDQSHYCIWCHNQGKDSCSKGMPERKATGFAKNGFGLPLHGCPLEEKISEMNTLKAEGVPLGALAVAMIDNPMIPATGHRICNDCVRACIYQRQQPVDIPQAETRTLKDVLELPWGFEIYSLFTRWNPLNLRLPVMRANSGYKVLVVGLGPAGYALSHFLMNDGHTVVAVDGLKIEPLPADLSGVKADGARVPFRPIRDVNTLYEPLGQRVTGGFGGVAEYGITVRWNKNFLKLIRLVLERRERMTMVGGVRFGGTLTIEDAFARGFDHVALCMGAGRPTAVQMKNRLARGVRQASDFLMALQLTGAAKPDSIASLQLRLPVVVIGGGLTAIDTATEALAYYPIQVEKFLARFERLVAEKGEAEVRRGWSAEETAIAETFLAHAHALRDERRAAALEGREARIAQMLRAWGGAVIAYRRRLVDSPAYTLNHEEIHHALAEGIGILEGVAPREVILDEFGAASAVRFARNSFDTAGVATPADEVILPAGIVLVAAGTQPNTVLAQEEADLVRLDGRNFQAIDETGAPVKPERSVKPQTAQVLMAKTDDDRFVSFFGDLHPSFSGNVVKALAGAKRGYPVLSRVMANRAPTTVTASALAARINSESRAFVERVNRLTPTIVEVVVHAPAAAQRFQPGQFFRLQNFESLAERGGDTTLAMEGCALTGAAVDRERGLLSLIVLEMGGSSSLVGRLKPGEPVILMGPTGTPTDIPTGETIALVGGGLGNAVLFSIGQAARAAGNRVLYFAGYRTIADRYKVEEIEKAADRIVWTCDQAPGFTPERPGDLTTVANIVETMRAYAAGELGPIDIPLADVDRMIVIGSDRMMAAVTAARSGVLAPYLKPGHLAIGSINSPMQCMMKEICAQCLQRHVDPVTGEEHIVFSCSNQDQDLDRVDFGNLNQRLKQNSLQEKLTAQWIVHCLKDSKAA